MTSHYDSYDYPSYWDRRIYEHEAEVLAIKSFIKNLPRLDTILDLGAGFGRLTPTYLNAAKKIILTDPSVKLLNLASKKFKGKKFKFIVGGTNNLAVKIKKESIDLILMIRVLHHIRNLENAFSVVHKLLKPGGYFILEYPNKVHAKAVLYELFRGNYTFPFNIFSKDVCNDRLEKENRIPFVNYHPDFIKELITKHDFTIEKIKSVSNFRSPLLKKIFPVAFLIFLSSITQDILAKVSFGPSIFILAKKGH